MLGARRSDSFVLLPKPWGRCETSSSHVVIDPTGRGLERIEMPRFMIMTGLNLWNKIKS
jgi:hypothetical protein